MFISRNNKANRNALVNRKYHNLHASGINSHDWRIHEDYITLSEYLYHINGVSWL